MELSLAHQKMHMAFVQQGEDCLTMPVLIKLASTELGLSNSFLLIELCRTCFKLKNSDLQILREWEADNVDPNRLSCFIRYLADYLENQHCSDSIQELLLPQHYVSAARRCLWYLQSSSRQVISAFLPLVTDPVVFSVIRSSLEEQLHLLKYLPRHLGIPRYLETKSSHLRRSALESLSMFLLHAPPASTTLLADLKRPFDAEVKSRTPLSFHKTMKTIHEYRMVSGMCTNTDDHSTYTQQYDIDHRKGPHVVEDKTSSVSLQDEPQPEFNTFLHIKGDNVFEPMRQGSLP